MMGETPVGEAAWWQSASMKMKGTVKHFNEARGFGFIVRDDGQSDLFFHITNVGHQFVETIDTGSRVEFEVGIGERNNQPQAMKSGTIR